MTIETSVATPDTQNLIDYHSKSCSRLLHGQCSTVRCLSRGGWKRGAPNYSTATCEEYETVRALSSISPDAADATRFRDALKRLRAACDEIMEREKDNDIRWTAEAYAIAEEIRDCVDEEMAREADRAARAQEVGDVG